MSSLLSSNIAPAGTKLWLLHVGNIVADAGFVVAGGNMSTVSPGKDYPDVWGAQLCDVFPRIDYNPDQELDAQIAKTGHDIKDVKAVIMGHLHLDHSGGLEFFKGTDVPIYVHEKEIKNAFYSVATKTDLGVYFPSYLNFNVNWKPFHGESWELMTGLTLPPCSWAHPGPMHSSGTPTNIPHTHPSHLHDPQVELVNSGTWIFTSDQYIVKENYEDSTPQGWFNRDHARWLQSHQMIQSIQKFKNAKLVFGHDKSTFYSHKIAPEFHD